MVPEGSSRPPFVRAIVKLAIGIVFLLIVQAVVGSIPVLNQAVPLGATYVTYASLARAALQTGIFVLLVKFGIELRPVAENSIPTVPAIGRIVQVSIWVIPVALAYTAYSDLAEGLLGSSVMWLYQLLFAIVAAGMLLTTAAAVFKNLDPLSDFVMHQLPHRIPRREATRCRSCGTKVSATARFCSNCGVSQADSTEVATSPKEELSCPKCQARVIAAQRFCRACGTALQAA